MDPIEDLPQDRYFSSAFVMLPTCLSCALKCVPGEFEDDEYVSCGCSEAQFAIRQLPRRTVVTRQKTLGIQEELLGGDEGLVSE